MLLVFKNIYKIIKIMFKKIVLFLRLLTLVKIKKVFILLLNGNFLLIWQKIYKSIIEYNNHYKIHMSLLDIKIFLDYINNQTNNFKNNMLPFVRLKNILPNIDLPTYLIFDHDMGGGANVYRNELVNNITSNNNITILLTPNYINNKLSHTTLSVVTKLGECKFILEDFTQLIKLIPNLYIKEVIYNNAVSYKNPLYVAELLIKLKENTKAKLIIMLHDHFLICPTFNLINNFGKYCNLPSNKICNKCLPNIPSIFGYQKIKIEKWRSHWDKTLQKADKIIAFSQSTADIITRIYNISDKIEVTPHKVDSFSRKPHTSYEGIINIGIIGHISEHKGSNIIVDIANIIKTSNLPITLTVIGTISSSKNIPNNIRIMGSYKRNSLPDIIEENNINICLLPSICPETFSYTTSEIIELGLPLCCYDLGAPAERVKKYKNGYIIEKITAEETLNLIQRCAIQGLL
jgi:hypothetical protein